MSSDDTLHDPPADDAPSGDLTGSGLIAEKSKRLLKLDQMRAAGGNPYPYRFDRTSTLAELRAQHGALDAGTETETEVAIAGRVMLSRQQASVGFQATLQVRNKLLAAYKDIMSMPV